MKEKTLKRISLISIAIILALALTLVWLVFIPNAQPEAQADADTLYKSEYVGDNGTTSTHFAGAAQYASANGISSNNVTEIRTGTQLYNFLNNNSTSVGLLLNDVSISYNASKDGFDRISANSSAAIFGKGRVFDGNGYTVNIYGGAGLANSSPTVNDTERASYRNGAAAYDNFNIWYEFTGYLVAQNYGTMKNFTVDYTSPHTVISATKGETGNANGDLGTSESNRILSNQEGVFIAGIVTGLNGCDGVIDNVRVNVINAFTAIKREAGATGTSKSGQFHENAAYAGAIAGRIEDNSKINYCWVDLAEGAGVFAGAKGKPTSFPLTDDHNSLAIAGGIVGNIDMGTAKITYCALSGSGQVKAFANRAAKNEKFRSYSGGVSGGCIKIVAASSVADSNYGIKVNSGQIKGIVSSWTGSRYANYDNSPKESMGSLFGSVGTDDEIESLAILYNLETLAATNKSVYAFKPVSSDGKLVLDAPGGNEPGNIRNWLEIHPTTDGGTMTVAFDTDNTTYDIRVHIVAEGHDDLTENVLNNVDMGGSRYYQFKMNSGEGGGFIWSAPFTDIFGEVSSHIDLIRDDPVYAEIYLLSSTNNGKYNYEFGRMGILNYSDTNGENGNLVKPYNGTAAPLSLPSVTMTNYQGFDTSVFSNERLWEITRSNKNVALSQTYMPGTYRMKLQTKVGERMYGYYNAEQRILAWQPKTDYLFTILQGELRFGSRTTPTDGWQDQVTFELTMNSKNDFDRIEFQRNGVFPADSALGFTRDNASMLYTVKDGTGKNGTAYTFYAYKQDAVSGEYVVVAVSESRTVRIDNEAPEVSEIEYYMVEEDGSERPLSEDDLDEIQEKWTKNQILAKFSVSDNGKSGIAIAETAPYISNKELNNLGDVEVVVTIDDSALKSLVYIDARGNKTTVELQFNVDRVQGRLSFSGATYQPAGRFNYSTKSVPVRYVAHFGSSDWRLYYSYQRDAQGNDIWIASPELLQNSGALKTLTIDWNMGDVNSGKGDDFKIKMVNETGLYEDEVFPLTAEGKRLPNDVVGNFIIWLRVANIYIDTNLNNIFVEGEDGKSVADILKNGESSQYFDKQYDGTDEYYGKKEYKFYTDLSALNASGFYYNDKLGVIYSPSGIFARPRIDIGDNGIVPVQLKYTSTEVGNTRLSFQVVLTGTDGFNYIVYFTDLSAIDFEEDVEVEDGTYWESFEIDAKINKLEVTIELSEQEAFNSKKVYYYGDEVPTSIEVYVEETQQYVTVLIDTQASSKANIGEYMVKGINPNGYSNVNYTVNATNITIQQRYVAVDLRFDGGEIGNIPTGVKAGRTHNITGDFTDINGETQKVLVEYVLNDKPVTSLGAVGLYTVNLTLPDNNYVIDGQSSFKFNIAKGYLEIETGMRIKDYTEGEIEYDLIIPQESRDLYEDSDLQITYYRYLDGAVYNATERTIEGKISNEAMTGLPTERGYYFVEVKFVTTDNVNFFPMAYSDGYLIISKAKTQVNVENVTLQYSFTSEKFTYNLIDAIAEVRSSSNKLLWSASPTADGSVKVQYKDSDGSFKDVAPTPNDGGGWYSETGRYEYKVTYNGNEDYDSSSINVVLVINKADLKGITFNSVEVVYDGNNHLPTVNGLLNYTDLKITFQYGATKIPCDGNTANDALKQFTFKDAREYTVYMTIEKDGYATKELQTKVNIKKAKMENVSAMLLDVVYDGQRHNVEFTGPGLEYDSVKGYTYKGESVIIKGGNSDGNAYATNVRIEEGVGPSYYSGEVTLGSLNYEDLVLKTHITIRQALLPYQEIGKTVPNKMPSGISLTEYNGYYVDNSGAKIECALQYRDRNGNVVELDADGKLPDGRYSVMLVVPDTNYYLDRYWNLDVGEINTAEISVYGGIAIGAVCVLMVGAIVTAIVVVKKRKKAGIV